MSSPTKHKRKSITSLFPDILLEHSASSTTRNRPRSPTKTMENLSTSLGKAFSHGWPTWRSTRNSNRDTSGDFTIRLTEELKAHALAMNLSEDPAIIIAKARNASIRAAPDTFFKMWTEIKDGLVTLVYGSNKIESAGTSLGITIHLCRCIFQGKPVSETDIEPASAEYKEHVEHLTQTQRNTSHSEIIRSRIEVIQHAKALNFLIDQVVLNGYDLSEELILHTHAILYHGLGDNDNIPGQYRTHRVAVSYGKPGEKKKAEECLRPSAVPRYMKELVKNLQAELENADKTKEIDPYTLAARYHHHFVMTHPFADGNGRMSRIILNVLLLKYAGHLSLFGSDMHDKDEYLQIVRRGGKVFREEDMEVEFKNQTSHREFARFVMEKSRNSLESMWRWAKH